MSSVKKTVILVTGGNKGIGYEAVRLLSQQVPSATILLGTRSLSNGQDAISKMQAAEKDKQHLYQNLQCLELDVTNKDSIANAVQRVKQDHGQLDVIMNNSGISNVDGEYVHKRVLDVNLYGVKDTIDAFLPVMAPQGKVITVSSEVGAWTTNACSPQLQETLLNPSALTWTQIDALAQDSLLPEGKSPWPSKDKTFGTYGVSKALVSAYTRTLAIQHPELQVAVVCPGYCATDLNHMQGPRSAVQGGESVIWPITHSFTSGQFYQDGTLHSWCSSRSKY